MLKLRDIELALPNANYKAYLVYILYISRHNAVLFNNNAELLKLASNYY